MRLFANQGALSKMLEKSFGEDESLEHGTLDWSIQNAQKKVEQQNYSIRKRLLQYDERFEQAKGNCLFDPKRRFARR